MVAKFFLWIVIICLSFISTSATAEQSFEGWLNDFRKEAKSKGVSEQTINESLLDIRSVSRVIELDRKQPERGNMTFAKYRSRVISDARIAQGRRMYRKHREELERAAQRYGVPAQYIVALWGIETSYGNNTGGFKIIPALATLAHEGRRAKFFRNELLNALKIIDAGHISAANMKGSWAGAMGQNQFMPSSFHSFAVDGNNDGKRDIWKSLPDVFASTANYLSRSGWREDQKWGRAVRAPMNLDENSIGRKNKKSLKEWSKLGVTLPNGQPIPVVDGMKAALVAPDGLSGAHFLVYHNFDVIMKWNRSTYFATSVGLLADQIVR